MCECMNLHKVGSWLACKLVVLTAGILRQLMERKHFCSGFRRNLETFFSVAIEIRVRSSPEMSNSRS